MQIWLQEAWDRSEILHVQQAPRRCSCCQKEGKTHLGWQELGALVLTL